MALGWPTSSRMTSRAERDLQDDLNRSRMTLTAPELPSLPEDDLNWSMMIPSLVCDGPGLTSTTIMI